MRNTIKSKSKNVIYFVRVWSFLVFISFGFCVAFLRCVTGGVAAAETHLSSITFTQSSPQKTSSDSAALRYFCPRASEFSNKIVLYCTLVSSVS